MISTLLLICLLNQARDPERIVGIHVHVCVSAPEASSN